MTNYEVITDSLSGNKMVHRVSDNSWIPCDLNNKDYKQYLIDNQG